MDLGVKAGDLSRWFEIEGDKRVIASDAVVEQSDALKSQVAKPTERVAQLQAA